MRTMLKRAGKNGRQRYTAIIECCNTHPPKVVMLAKVKLNGKMVTDHLWLADEGQFNGIRRGSEVEFDADVTEYEKGYFGHCKKASEEKPIKKDYQLTNISNVEVVKRRKGQNND